MVNAATTGTLTDSATVTVNGNNATDPTIANNTATTSSSISSSADVGIGFSVSPPSPQGIGGNLTYTVQVFNNGPSVAYNVTITDDFLATNTNLTFVSQTPGNVPGIVLIGTPGTNVADTIASLPVGVFTFQIVAQIKQTVAANTVVTNKVTIAASGSTDPVPSNNSGTSPGVTAIVNSDVAVAITNVSPSAPVAGAPLTYTITLTNNGPTNATGVMFSTITPANTTFTSVSASPALTFPTQPIPGATGPIASGATAIAAGSVVTITLTLNVNSNTAKSTNIQLTGSETSTSNDLTAGNNSATSPITSSMTNADVTIPSLSTLSPTVQTPGTITYTFNVVNNGPSDATGIIINDTLPAAATFVSMTQSGSSVVATVNGSNALTYTIPGSISSAAGSNTIPFTITVSIPSSASNLASISNTVSLTVGVGGSTDTNLGNNSASATVAVGSNADLGIAVVVSANPVVGGNVLTYTVTLTNNGPSDAQLPQFSFPIPGPGQVTFNSVTIPNNWTQTSTNNAGDTSGTITATVPTMAAGAPPVVFRLTFTVNPNISSSLVNTPTIFSVAVPSTPDTTLANNSATNFTVATKPQPTVSVNTISVPEGDPGVGSVDYTISLSAANTQVVSVDYATVDGTATNPFDYIQASGTLMFNPGETSKTVSIQIIGDALVEPTKSFTLHVSNPVNTTILANDGVCTILNDDFGGAFGFTAANFVVNESDGTATITVQRPAAATADKTFVSYATSDGSAIAGLDYVATSGVLNFTFGQQTQTFTVKLLNPVAAVAGATVKLTLSNPRSLDAKNNVIVLPGASATLDPNATTSTLTILARPAITSTLLVHTLIGAQFSYTPTATGDTPVFYSLGANATLPPGLNFTPGFGYITGVPTKVSVPVDAFKVPIVATNSVGSVMQTLTIVVDANVASGGSNSLLDSDGDGYPDELELAVGSDPLDAMSTPLNIKKLTLTGIKNLKLKINLDFTLLGNDSITLTGIVVMPPDFGQSGKLVYFDIGGVIRRFALDANGLSKVGDDNVKFKIGKPGGDGKSTATFKLSITKGDFQSTSATNPLLKNAFPLLDDEGLTNTTVKAQARVVPVMILLNSSLYNVMQNQVYTSTQGKSGKTSNP